MQNSARNFWEKMKNKKNFMISKDKDETKELIFTRGGDFEKSESLELIDYKINLRKR